MLNILIEIQQGLQDIAPVDITRAEMSLAPKAPGDKPLGIIMGEASRKIMALSRRYAGSASDLGHRASFDAATEDDKEELQREAHRMVHAAGICLDMFWMEARNELGGTAWDEGEIGIRRGWMLVRPAKRSGIQAFARMFEPAEE